jgi:hypothetical protein
MRSAASIGSLYVYLAWTASVVGAGRELELPRNAPSGSVLLHRDQMTPGPALAWFVFPQLTHCACYMFAMELRIDSCTSMQGCQA